MTDDLLRYLYSHPGYIGLVRAAVAWTQTRKSRFRWSDIRALPRDLNRMVLDGIMDRHPDGTYSVHDPASLSRALANYMAEQRKWATIQSARAPPSPSKLPPGAPPELFRSIIGYEAAKRMTLLALSARSPIHVLYYGSVGSGKSLFLEELSRLPGAIYRFGDSVTRAGLRREILEEKPTYLIIDELDKMDPEESSALLETMERGTASVLQYDKSYEVHADVRVFAAANRISKLRPELLSRFLRVEMPEYTYEEFRQVAYAYLLRRGVHPDIARILADGVGLRTRDIRDARRLGDMAHTKEDAIWLIGQLGTQTKW